jgi:circadian clock protein KaiC
MKASKKKSDPQLPSFLKTPTGINGLDEITLGGIPSTRCTLICGSAGCGKTLFAIEYLVRGAIVYNEPGVFLAFEETAEELAQNVASLGYDLEDLIKRKLLKIDFISINRAEIEETGEYDLEGLFIRLGYAIDTIGAKRVAIDTIESLFVGLSNEGILRAELRRLFHWLKDKNVTSIITGERGDGSLTRQGLEEYVSDCVILLDHRLTNQISTRRLRIIKYRGSVHGTNEYPFLIDESGISVLPITSLKLDHKVSNEVVSTGLPALNVLLGLGGFYKGSSVMISGTAGSAKTILSAHIVSARCKNNERVLYFAFEESQNQLIRNIASVGIDYASFIKQGLLQIHSTRPTLYGLEMHLLNLYNLINSFKPSLIIVDPMTDLISIGPIIEVRSMLTRLIDMLKINNITAVFTSLSQHYQNSNLLATEESIASLIDTWIKLTDLEGYGEKNRVLSIIKSRGMSHSNQVREFIITNKGIDIQDVYLGGEGVLTGRARMKHQQLIKSGVIHKESENLRKMRELERKRKILNAQIASLETEFESEEDQLLESIEDSIPPGLITVEDQKSVSKNISQKAVGKNIKKPVTKKRS